MFEITTRQSTYMITDGLLILVIVSIAWYLFRRSVLKRILSKMKELNEEDR